MPDLLQQRLIELEILYAEQERTIEELSGEIAKQWRTITAMNKKLSALTDRFLTLEEQATPEIPVTKPPHW